MRAAAGGVLFFARGHVAGAHGAGGFFAAGADSDAAQRGFAEGAVIVGKLEKSFRARGSVACAESQRFFGLIESAGAVDGLDDLVGIHAVARIPQRFEFAEGRHEVGAKHFGEERAAGLAVAMLAGERAAVGENDVGGAFDEEAKFADARFGFEVEVDARVDAALAEVAVERAAVAKLLHESGELAEVGTELRGRNGGVLPTFPSVGLAGDEDHGAECRFADEPDAGGFGGRIKATHSGRRFEFCRGSEEVIRFSLGFFVGLGAELGEEEAAAFGEQAHVVDSKALAAHEVEKHGVDAFEADRAVFDDFGNGIGGEECVRESKHDETATGRRVHQVESRAKDGDECAFAADQGARDVEVVFREKLIEVVSRDAAWNFGEAAADFVGVLIADAAHACVDLSGTATSSDDCGDFFLAGGADGHLCSVVEKNLQSPDVVGGQPAHDGVGTAGVVADHAADGAAIVGGRVGSEGQVMDFGGFTDAIEHDSRFDDGDSLCGVERDKTPHVFRKVEDDGDVAALTGEAGARTAGEDGRTQFATGGDGGFDVGSIVGKDEADGGLAVVRGVGRVEGAGGGVETDFATDGGA